MVWGCFSYYVLGRLHLIAGNVNADYYKKVIIYCVKPSRDHLFGSQPCLFMQENAPAHKARSVMQVFEQECIQLLDWPGQNPDLNPIENLWRYIKARLSKTQSKNRQELFQKLQKIWDEILQQHIRTLIDSMPRRIAMCVRQHGGITKY